MASRESPISTNVRTFVRSSLSSGLRLDGRSPSDVRSVSLTFGDISGSGRVAVQIGHTRVIGVTTADLVAPFVDRPNEGALNLFVSFSPMASLAYESAHASAPTDTSIEIARLVERGLRESRAIDTESLCVLAGAKVWSVRLDLHVVDDDGNLVDALALAAVSALMHFRRPDVTVVGDTVTIHSVDDRQPIALALHHIPICSTFAFFEPSSSSSSSSGTSTTQSTLWLIDPTREEERVSDASFSITLNKHGDVCCMQKSGGAGVDLALIMSCAAVARTKTEELTLLIESKLKEDAARHNTGNAVRGVNGQIQYNQQLKAKPIDSFGSNVTKAKGEHQVAGKPIEIDMNVREADVDSEDDEDEDEDEDKDEEDNDEDEEGEADDSSMMDAAAAAEFQRVAAKFAAKTNVTAATAATTSAAATKGTAKR